MTWNLGTLLFSYLKLSLKLHVTIGTIYSFEFITIKLSNSSFMHFTFALHLNYSQPQTFLNLIHVVFHVYSTIFQL